MNQYERLQIDSWDSLWVRFSGELLAGSTPALEDPTLDTRRYLTTVTRLPPELTSVVEGVQSLLQAVDGRHYFYPTNELHLTVLGCSEFTRSSSAVTPEDVKRIGSVCSKAFADTHPFTLKAFGLNTFPTGIFLQLIANSDALERARLSLRAELENECGRNGLESLVPQPFLAYANIVRFKTQDVRALLDAVMRRRECELGATLAERIELVTTDKLFSVGNTKTWDTFILRSQKE